MSQPATVRDIRDDVRRRSRSASEVCRAALERLEAVEPSLHAFNTITRDQALARAAEIDRDFDRWRDRPLVGVPIALLPRRRAVNRGAIVRQGMMVGLVIGAVTGLVQGSARDRSERENPGASCDPYCGGHALVDAPLVALLGLGLGAAAGAIVAHFANQ